MSPFQSYRYILVINLNSVQLGRIHLLNPVEFDPFTVPNVFCQWCTYHNRKDVERNMFVGL